MSTPPKHSATNSHPNFLWGFGGKGLIGGVYEYSFNTQMHTDEISGTGNHTTALFWEYDTRLGRRWNLDPKLVAWESQYAVNRGNPILLNDPNGNWVPVRFGKNVNKEQTKDLIIEMFKNRYGLEVEFKKRKFFGLVFGYKLQLKEGQSVGEKMNNAKGDWVKVLLRNKKTRNKLIIEKNKPYDGGVTYKKKKAYIDLSDFNSNKILDIDGSEVDNLPFEAQDDQFSLRSIIEHEFLYHAVEDLDDYINNEDDSQSVGENTTIGKVNRNRVAEKGSDAYIRKNYKSPGENGGVTTIGKYKNDKNDIKVKYRNPAPGESGYTSEK